MSTVWDDKIKEVTSSLTHKNKCNVKKIEKPKKLSGCMNENEYVDDNFDLYDESEKKQNIIKEMNTLSLHGGCITTSHSNPKRTIGKIS